MDQTYSPVWILLVLMKMIMNLYAYEYNLCQQCQFNISFEKVKCCHVAYGVCNLFLSQMGPINKI